MGTLTKVLDLLTNRVKHLAEEDITDANISQIWGILLLLFVMIISPILVILAKNAISSIQVSKLVGSRVHFNHARLSRAAMHGKKACISARIILVMCQNVRGFLHSPKWLLQPTGCILSEDRPRVKICSWKFFVQSCQMFSTNRFFKFSKVFFIKVIVFLGFCSERREEIG